MKKIWATLILTAGIAGFMFAQQGVTSSVSDPDPNEGQDSAEWDIKEVSVDLFEREGSWNARISPDNGVIAARLFDAPAFENKYRAKSDGGDPIPSIDGEQSEEEGTKSKHVLGVKAEFFHRGVNSFYITAVRPLPIEGVTKMISVYIAGRNQPHKLTLLIQDYYGHNFELYMGTLDFSGWKKMSVKIPPSPDGRRGIIQSSAYHGDRPGVRVVGFRVDCDPELAMGSYYMYFDDLRAFTDLYDISHMDEDDMVDNW
ncbi:MAG: flagellar filament outer layer protein FlaA [Bacteroides sp.]|nr:flagellar filament outer layer protein FlaA [Prevotella sp.]MCM1407447.1 flagellar filament outer layer protein FlaA [Treponema brennaborense]MCM1469937.1 flagellar filament outer layer protein FlaA [Bacteroides sp.]